MKNQPPTRKHRLHEKNKIQFLEDREVIRPQTKNKIFVLFLSFHLSQKYLIKTLTPTRDVIL